MYWDGVWYSVVVVVRVVYFCCAVCRVVIRSLLLQSLWRLVFELVYSKSVMLERRRLRCCAVDKKKKIWNSPVCSPSFATVFALVGFTYFDATV